MAIVFQDMGLLHDILKQSMVHLPLSCAFSYTYKKWPVHTLATEDASVQFEQHHHPHEQCHDACCDGNELEIFSCRQVASTEYSSSCYNDECNQGKNLKEKSITSQKLKYYTKSLHKIITHNHYTQSLHTIITHNHYTGSLHTIITYNHYILMMLISQQKQFIGTLTVNTSASVLKEKQSKTRREQQFSV